MATHLISNRRKQFDVLRDELPTPKFTKIANLQMLNETDKREIKSSMESAEKFRESAEKMKRKNLAI